EPTQESAQEWAQESAQGSCRRCRRQPLRFSLRLRDETDRSDGVVSRVSSAIRVVAGKSRRPVSSAADEQPISTAGVTPSPIEVVDVIINPRGSDDIVVRNHAATVVIDRGTVRPLRRRKVQTLRGGTIRRVVDVGEAGLPTLLQVVLSLIEADSTDGTSVPSARRLRRSSNTNSRENRDEQKCETLLHFIPLEPYF